VQGIIARVTVILPLIVGVVFAIALDLLDDLMGILTAVKDGKITIEEQEAIDTRRSNRRWAALRALAGKAPYFTVE
tara:strand:- start:442 stop:669 length:228 start_codon:yes stop_codon:yes gene_type:complete